MDALMADMLRSAIEDLESFRVYAREHFLRRKPRLCPICGKGWKEDEPVGYSSYHPVHVRCAIRMNLKFARSFIARNCCILLGIDHKRYVQRVEQAARELEKKVPPAEGWSGARVETPGVGRTEG